MIKVLVTGSTGNIGSYVAEKLIDKEVDVKAAVRNKEKGQHSFQIAILKSLSLIFCARIILMKH